MTSVPNSRRVAAALWAPVLVACVGSTAHVKQAPGLLGGGRPLLAAAGEVALDSGAASDDSTIGLVTTRQRESECHLAIAHMWRILAPRDSVGAEVEFT